MSEAELHVLRARLLGRISATRPLAANFAAAFPWGFVWGEEEGEVRFYPDEAVLAAIRAVFARFAELGSVRRVWLWFRAEGLSFLCNATTAPRFRWVDPSYIAIYHVLTNPVYAGVLCLWQNPSRDRARCDGAAQEAHAQAAFGAAGRFSSASTTKASSIWNTYESQIALAPRPIPIRVRINSGLAL